MPTQYSGKGQGGPDSNKIKRNLVYWMCKDNNINYAASGAAWALYKCMVWWLASWDCVVTSLRLPLVLQGFFFRSITAFTGILDEEITYLDRLLMSEVEIRRGRLCPGNLTQHHTLFQVVVNKKIIKVEFFWIYFNDFNDFSIGGSARHCLETGPLRHGPGRRSVRQAGYCISDKLQLLLVRCVTVILLGWVWSGRSHGLLAHWCGTSWQTKEPS